MLAFLDRGDGVCRYFVAESNLCSIYEERPLLCRVDESYDAIFAGQMTREEYEQLNYDACKAIKSKFRV